MKKKYWKDIGQSFILSKGRFFSIFGLMAIGSLALVGLKVTPPNMEGTAQRYINTYNMADLTVISDYGLSDEDVSELKTIKDVTIEYGYLTDVTVKNSGDAIRVFSNSHTVSKYKLISGKMPSMSDEIALDSIMRDDYKIGDEISFTQSNKGILKRTTFTVTGFVNSSDIWDEHSMGASSAGYGELNGYGITTDTAFNSNVYSLARISYDDLNHVNYYSDNYTRLVNKHRKDLDKLLADNGNNRLVKLKADGQAKIDEGYANILSSEQKIANGAQQLADSKSQIDSSQSQINTAKVQVDSNTANIAQAASQLAQGQDTLNLSYIQLVSAKQQLDSAKATLDSTKVQLDSAYVQLDTGLRTLNTKKDQLDIAGSQLTDTKTILDNKKTQLDSSANQLTFMQAALTKAQTDLQRQKDSLTAAGDNPESDPNIISMEDSLTQQASILSTAQSEYDSGLSQYNIALATYDASLTSYQLGLEQYNTGLDEYNINSASYESGMAQYNSALATYNTNLTSYEDGVANYNLGLMTLDKSQAEYESGVQELESIKSTISENQAHIDAAVTSLAESTADYESKKDEAENEIAVAKAKLDKSQLELNSLQEPTYTSYTRSTLPGSDGYVTYSNSSSSISAVGSIFPVVLYLVAAMVTFTTMTRFVDEERSNAGIFKALGYTNRRIIAKFVIYGLVASLTGTLVGIAIGNFVISPKISDIISVRTVIGSSNLYFYPFWIFIAFALAIVSAVLPAYLVANKELTENPAKLLLSKPPVSGSKILLERVSFIWRRLNFTQKVTARNIFRYKQRMLMTVFGVAGSVALLFAGLGIQSSISGIVSSQFGNILKYDMIVSEKRGALDADKEKLTKALESSNVEASLATQYTNINQPISGLSDNQSISLLVTDSNKISNFINLRDRITGVHLDLINNGAIISEKLSKLYNVKVGENISLTINNKIVKVKVSGISEMYAGHFIYMTKGYYEKLTNTAYNPNAYLVTLSDNSQSTVKSTSADLMAMDAVSAVVQNSSLTKQLETVSESLSSVMIILVIVSILLAVVILYNLTNINVEERIRELSTIKVLGFHNKEVTMYIYRETITLSIVGIITGLAGGYVLHRAILNIIGSNSIMFNPNVAFYVYLVPILVIIGILTLLGLLVNNILKRVDMLEALKSVE